MVEIDTATRAGVQVIAMNSKLSRDLDSFEKNRGRCGQMVSRHNELTAEVKRLEAQFSEYNLVIQQSTTQATSADVQRTIVTTQDETRLVQVCVVVATILVLSSIPL